MQCTDPLIKVIVFSLTYIFDGSFSTISFTSDLELSSLLESSNALAAITPAKTSLGAELASYISWWRKNKYV